jgi:hypothetical protein
VLGAEHRVDLGDFHPQLFAVAFGETASDDQPAARAGRLVAGHLEDGVDRFLLRRVDEGAGVDDQHLGRGGVVGQLMAGVVSQAEHHLRIHQVLRAAERDQTNLHEEANSP